MSVVSEVLVREIGLLGILLRRIAREGEYIEIATGIKKRHPQSVYLGPNQVDEAWGHIKSKGDVYINYFAQREALSKRSEASNAIDGAVLVFDLERPEWHKKNDVVPRDEIEALFQTFLSDYGWVKEHIFYAVWTGRGCQVVCFLENRKDATQYKVLSEALKAYFNKDYIDKASFGYNRLMRAPFSRRIDLSTEHTVEVIYYNPECKLIKDEKLYAVYRPNKQHNSKEYKDVIEKIKSRASFEDFVEYTSQHGDYSRLLCPFHDERNPSAFVYHNADGEVLVDGHTGEVYDVISFYQKKYNVDFRTAVKELCEKYNIELPGGKKKQKEIKEVAIEVPESAEEIDGVYVFHDDFRFYVIDKNTGAKRIVGPYFRIEEAENYFYVFVHICENFVRKDKIHREDFTLQAARKACNIEDKKYASHVYTYAIKHREVKNAYRYGYNKNTDYYLTQRNEKLIDGLIDDEGNYRQRFSHNVDEQYLSFVKDVLSENKVLAECIAYALSPLLENYGMLFIRGRSGVGKSTIARFISAFHGDLFFSAPASTVKGIMAVLSEIDGACVVIDEVQKYPEVLHETITFALSGDNRVHASQKRSAVYSRKTTNCLVSTSEREFDSSKYKSLGISRRIWNMEITSWKDVSEKYSVLDLINNTKYGLASLVFDFIKANNLREKYDKVYVPSEYTYINKTIAMCYILQDFFEIDLAPTINRLMQQASVKPTEEVINKDVIIELAEFIDKNEAKFYAKERKYVNEFWGWYQYRRDGATPIDGDQGEQVVDGLNVNATFFNEFTRFSNKIDKRTLVNKLFEIGVLKERKSKNKRCWYNGLQVKVYYIDREVLDEYIHRLTDEEDNTLPPSPPPSQPTPPVSPSNGNELDDESWLETSVPEKTNKPMETYELTEQSKNVKVFLDAILRSGKPKENVIKISEFYETYLKFCELKGIEPIRRSAFWAELESLCPNLDTTQNSYTLGELQAIIFIDLSGNPGLTKFVAMLKPQSVSFSPEPRPNHEEILSGFYKGLAEKPWPAEQTVRGDELYKLYEEYCREHGYSIKVTPDKFWEWTKREFKDHNGEPLDWRHNYTLGELRNIIAKNDNIAPF